MTPYYEQSGVTIYHGDCSEVIEGLGLHWGAKVFDLLLTDPPYGIGHDHKHDLPMGEMGRQGRRKSYPQLSGWDNATPPMTLLMDLCSLTRVQIVWGGNFLKMPPSQKWLVWDKGQRIDQSDGELAWTSMAGALRIYTLSRVELLRDGAVHPTQKPERLMRWCIQQAGDPTTIFDPFMGAGSTLVAAKRIGKTCVGIEREEKYCEIAARRLQQEALPLEVA